MKDHYKILGVQTSATQQEIKKAFRSLAMQYHPDKNPDNVFAQARFIEVQEAYSTLSDSRLREKYDDERWLMGMGKKTDYSQAITPSWIFDVAKKLNASLAQMDIHRISHRALQEYILLILSDAHIGVLLQHNDEEKNSAIIIELLRATQNLELKYLYAINSPLHAIAHNLPHMQQAINENVKAKERYEIRERLLPYFIIIITLALCVLMYFYGK